MMGPALVNNHGAQMQDRKLTRNQEQKEKTDQNMQSKLRPRYQNQNTRQFTTKDSAPFGAEALLNTRSTSRTS